MIFLCSLFFFFIFLNSVTLEYQDKAGFPPEVIYGPGSTFDYINEVYLKLNKLLQKHLKFVLIFQYSYLKYLSSSTEDLITFLFLEKNSLIQLRNKNGSDSENYRRYISELDYKYVLKVI